MGAKASETGLKSPDQLHLHNPKARQDVIESFSTRQADLVEHPFNRRSHRFVQHRTAHFALLSPGCGSCRSFPANAFYSLLPLLTVGLTEGGDESDVMPLPVRGRVRGAVWTGNCPRFVLGIGCSVMFPELAALFCVDDSACIWLETDPRETPGDAAAFEAANGFGVNVFGAGVALPVLVGGCGAIGESVPPGIGAPGVTGCPTDCGEDGATGVALISGMLISGTLGAVGAGSVFDGWNVGTVIGFCCASLGAIAGLFERAMLVSPDEGFALDGVAARLLRP